MSSIQEKIDYLLANYGIDDQRTQAWFAKRGQMITASEVYKCFGDASSSSRRELILSKLVPPKKQDGQGIGALIWGTRFESIAKEIYCATEKIKIVDLSCVQHPEHSFMGASPDGLIMSDNERHGRLIEIKCPISRVFTDETPVPDTYYHQMQLQLECTGLQECEYVEFQFKVVTYSQWVDSKNDFKSCFAVSRTAEVKYFPLGSLQTLDEWQTDVLTSDEDWQFVYWYMAKKRTQLIQKDMEWMPQHFPEIKATWDEILEHRTAGTIPMPKVTTLKL